MTIEKKKSSTRLASATAFALALGIAAAVATHAEAKKQAPAVAEAPSVDPRATEIVQRMAARIVAAERMSVGGEVAWDVVQGDGQTVEFGATRELVLQRPDQLRVDITLREGGKRRLLYDGKQIVLENLEQNVHAIEPRGGSVDSMLAFASTRLGIPVALAEFLSPDLPKLLGDGLESASWVGESTVDAVRCDHVVLRNAVGGIQLWIGQEDSLPRRVTITYEHAEGRPQFRARFAAWDLSPTVTDATFAFEPAKDTEKIAFVPHPAPRHKGDSK